MKHVTLVSVLVGGLSLALLAQGPTSAVQAAADTMGVGMLQSIQYQGADRPFLSVKQLHLAARGRDSS